MVQASLEPGTSRSQVLHTHKATRFIAVCTQLNYRIGKGAVGVRPISLFRMIHVFSKLVTPDVSICSSQIGHYGVIKQRLSALPVLETSRQLCEIHA